MLKRCRYLGRKVFTDHPGTPKLLRKVLVVDFGVLSIIPDVSLHQFAIISCICE